MTINKATNHLKQRLSPARSTTITSSSTTVTLSVMMEDETTSSDEEFDNICRSSSPHSPLITTISSLEKQQQQQLCFIENGIVDDNCEKKKKKKKNRRFKVYDAGGIKSKGVAIISILLLITVGVVVMIVGCMSYYYSAIEHKHHHGGSSLTASMLGLGKLQHLVFPNINNQYSGNNKTKTQKNLVRSASSSNNYKWEDEAPTAAETISSITEYDPSPAIDLVKKIQSDSSLIQNEKQYTVRIVVRRMDRVKSRSYVLTSVIHHYSKCSSDVKSVQVDLRGDGVTRSGTIVSLPSKSSGGDDGADHDYSWMSTLQQQHPDWDLILPSDGSRDNEKTTTGATTAGVFLVDEDLLIPCADLKRAFNLWRHNPDRLTGFYPMSHSTSVAPLLPTHTNRSHLKAKKKAEKKTKKSSSQPAFSLKDVEIGREDYSLLQDRAVFIHHALLDQFPPVPDFIFNSPCKNIALSVMLTSITSKPPLLYLPEKNVPISSVRLHNSTISNKSSDAASDANIMDRDECLSSLIRGVNLRDLPKESFAYMKR